MKPTISRIRLNNRAYRVVHIGAQAVSVEPVLIRETLTRETRRAINAAVAELAAQSEA